MNARIEKVEGMNAGQVVERWLAEQMNGEFVNTTYDIKANGLRYEVKTLNAKGATLKTNESKSTPNGWSFKTPTESCEQLAKRIVGNAFDRLMVVKTIEENDHYTVLEITEYAGQQAVEYIVASASYKKQGENGQLRLASNPESTKCGGQAKRHETLVNNGHAIH